MKVYLGIQLLSSEIKQLSDQKKAGNSSSSSSVEELTEKLGSILKDINDSCSISINILNDLLLIDKIEEGNLILEIDSINAKELVEPCIQNFDIQVSRNICKILIFILLMQYIYLLSYL
jgi:signal transduction histidine kinase